MSPIVSEGYAPLYLDGAEYRTFFRVVGDIGQSLARGMAPLVLLHGGPGSTHNYFETLDPLAETGRAVVMYDQLGCGESTVEGPDGLWCARTWVEELKNLRAFLGLDRMHLLGQSWGGMLAIQYLCDEHPAGVASVVLSSTLPSSQLWGREQHRLIAQMAPEDQAAIARAEQTGDYADPAYRAAEARYMQAHCADAEPGPGAPACLTRPKVGGRASYLAAWGPNEFTPAGSLRDWDYTAKLPDIGVPALVISGSDDLCTPLVAQTMRDAIPGARWELFEGCRHMCFVEDNPRYLLLVDGWMVEHDGAPAR